MPEGRYTVKDDGMAVGTESFRCAPGPIGWRYVSEIDTTDPAPHRGTVDIAVDTDWRLVRLRFDTGDHQVQLEPRGSVLTGLRDGEEIELAYGPDRHVDVFTPSTNAITTQRLDGTAEIEVVYLAPYTLEPSIGHQRYDLHGPDVVDTPCGRFDAVRWTFTDLDSGWTADLWVAGPVVVAYERLFDLAWYEAGATGARPRT